jgi:hypothetical protein
MLIKCGHVFCCGCLHRLLELKGGRVALCPRGCNQSFTADDIKDVYLDVDDETALEFQSIKERERELENEIRNLKETNENIVRAQFDDEEVDFQNAVEESLRDFSGRGRASNGSNGLVLFIGSAIVMLFDPPFLQLPPRPGNYDAIQTGIGKILVHGRAFLLRLEMLTKIQSLRFSTFLRCSNY